MAIPVPNVFLGFLAKLVGSVREKTRDFVIALTELAVPNR
jgi:hypothetical protein